MMSEVEGDLAKQISHFRGHLSTTSDDAYSMLSSFRTVLRLYIITYKSQRASSRGIKFGYMMAIYFCLFVDLVLLPVFGHRV